MSEREQTPKEREDEARPRVKVTDRRRVRPDPEVSGSQDQGGEPAEVRSGGEPAPGSEMEQARQEVAEYREHLQRLAAEFDNYRKRVLKEQTRAVEMASEPLMHKLLEVLDEFELALMAAERRPEFEQFLRGVELVYAKLMEILRSEGLEPIESVGRPFDPALHEALMQSGEGSGEPVVVDVLRRGYTLKGRVLRPAGVKVSRREAADGPAEA